MGNNENGALSIILSIGTPFSYFGGQNMNHNTKEQDKDENRDNDDEDLRRFLRGGFGAK